MSYFDSNHLKTKEAGESRLCCKKGTIETLEKYSEFDLPSIAVAAGHLLFPLPAASKRKELMRLNPSLTDSLSGLSFSDSLLE
jgi:hypothetical protein